MNTPNPAPSAPGISTEVRRTFRVEGEIEKIRTTILILLGRSVNDQATVRVKEKIATITFLDAAAADDGADFLATYQFDGGARLVPCS